MEIIQDYNKDGKIDWKDFLFYSLTITGNIIFTIFNIVH
jgi:hypothetical protein